MEDSMKGIFLRALSLALLIPAAMVVAVDQRAAAEATKPATTESAKPAESAWYERAWETTKATATDSVAWGKENPVKLGLGAAAVAAAGYGLYSYLSPKAEDKNVKSAKAAGSNSDVDYDRMAQVQIPTIKVEDIQKDIEQLTKLVAAAKANLAAKDKAVALMSQKDKDGKPVFVLNSLNAVKAINANYVRRLTKYIQMFDGYVMEKKADSVQRRHDALVKYVNAIIGRLNFVKAQQVAVDAAKTAAPAAGSNSTAKSTWETIKSYATLKTALVAAAAAAGAYGVYHYFPTIKAFLGLGKEVATTAVAANEASKLVKEAPKSEATSNKNPQAVAKK